MKYFGLFLLSLLLVLVIAPLIAASTQEEICEKIVQTALEEAGEVCEEAGRNQACYGHVMLEAQPQVRLEQFKFDEVGDTVDVTQLKSLRLSPMDVLTGTWGVALMNLQANLPDNSPGENVTLLLFGDVEIDNAIPVATSLQVMAIAPVNVNVRRDPFNDAFVLGSLPRGTSVTARGRTEDNSWLYVSMPDNSENGWVQTRLMNVPDIDRLSVIRPSLANYGPMQAFYVRTGDKASTCEQAPNDGLLIQTPEGVGEVRLWINEVKIRLGSTVFVQAGADSNMTITTLEGSASVEAMGVEFTAVAGTSVSVPLDENRAPSAPPSPPQAYERQRVRSLPVEQLEHQITVEPPLIVEVTQEITQESLPAATATPTDVPPPTATETPTDVPTPTATHTPTDAPMRPTATDTPTNAPPEITETLAPTQTDTVFSSSTEEVSGEATEEATPVL